MLISEEEAKKKWCPFIRLTTTIQDDVWTNRGASNGSCACEGSKCMAWRWDFIGGKKTGKGFCGLAGQADGEKEVSK